MYIRDEDGVGKLIGRPMLPCRKFGDAYLEAEASLRIRTKWDINSAIAACAVKAMN